MVRELVPVNLTVTRQGTERLARFLAGEKNKAKRAAAAYADRHRLAELDGPAAAAIRAAIRDRRLSRRQAGRLFDTQDAAVAEAVRRELISRGIDPDNPPEFEPGYDLPGRPLGAAGIPFATTVNASIPRSYAAGVAAAAWYASQDTIRELREWDRRNGYDNTVPGGLLSPAQWAQRQKITARIVTRGDVYRAAIEALR
jgi:hypothetical protein